MVKRLLFYCLITLISIQLSAQYNRFLAFKNEQGKWGYKEDETGIVRIAPQYDDARNFSGSAGLNYAYAAVKKYGKWGYIDKTGKVVFDFVYDKAGHFQGLEEMAIVKREGKWFKLTTDGEHVSSPLLGKDYDKRLEEEFNEEESRFNPKDYWSLLESNEMYDPKYALKSMKEDAEKGDAEAMYKVGEIYSGNSYYLGSSKEYVNKIKNDQEAFYWIKRATEKGNESAKFRMAQLLIEGKGTSKNEPEGVKIIKSIADKGNSQAMEYLGKLYVEGKVVPQNLEEAFALYKKTAEKGSYRALIQLGHLYSMEWPKKDLKEAFNAFLKASGRGYPEADYNLALCYSGGIGTEVDNKKAIAYFNNVRDKIKSNPNNNGSEIKYGDDPDYWNTLAYCYFDLQNDRKAFESLDFALQKNPKYANAFDSKGEMFLMIGDTTKAIEYYRKAASMGYKNAIDWLNKNKFNTVELKQSPLTVAIANGKEEFNYFNDGRIKSYGKLYNNKRVGEWRFYYSGGLLEALQPHNELGELHGKVIYYYPNGKLKELGYFNQGKRDGLTTWYYNNGNIQSKFNYTNGAFSGSYEMYFETGGLQQKGLYSNTKINGEVFFYHPNGKRLGSLIYKDGLHIQTNNFFDENGNDILTNGSGLYKEYHNNGKVSALIQYSNYCRNGKAQFFHNNGQLREEFIFKYSEEKKPIGLRWEIVSSFDQNGKEREKGTLKEGNGTWVKYDADGKKTVEEYINGIKK